MIVQQDTVILQIHIGKINTGKHILFDDNTELKCADNHLMVYNNTWIFADDVNIGDNFNDKIVTSITNLPEQEWVDFTIDALHHTYIHNNIIHHNSGKSHIIYLIIRFLLQYTNFRILLVVPGKGLVSQLVSDFSSYVNDGYYIENDCHKIAEGSTKFSDKRVIVSTFQSITPLFKSDTDYSAWFDYDVILVDEAHQATAKSISDIIEALQEKSQIRLGFTGSIEDTKVNVFQLKSLFGDLYTTATSRELMNIGVQSELDIEVNIIKYNKEDLTNFYLIKKTYPKEISWIITNKKRNNFIIDKALNSDNNFLILFNQISHGKHLVEEINKKALQYNKVVYYIAGEIKTEEREEIKRLIELNDNLILVFSYGTMKQGENMPNLHYVLFAHPFESHNTNIQSIGRGLRVIKGKKERVKLIDIGDDLRLLTKGGNVKKQNYAIKHLFSRIKMYDEEQFSYTIKNIEI